MAHRDGGPPVGAVAALPRRWVAAIGGSVVIVLLLVSSRYGWHRDELYFREAGQHLAWGYVDQPPLTPVVAAAAEWIAPANLVVLRALPALATGATILMAALLARELGGTRPQQVLASAAVATGGFVLGAGHLLSTATFDLLAWMTLLCVLVRLLRTGDRRLWVLYGGLAGTAMLNKNLVVLLTGSIAVGLVAGGRGQLLRSRWLLVGAVVAAAVAAPNLLWQAEHGWPQQDMASELADRLGTENRLTLVPMQVLLVGPPLVLYLVRGGRWLLQSTTHRPVLFAWAAAMAVVLLTGGRPYYVLPLTIALAIAGLVGTSGEVCMRRAAWCIAANGLVVVPLALPLLPVSTVEVAAVVNESAVEQLGWPELARQVAAIVEDLPAGERSSVVLLAGTYGEAGALDRFGPALGLPPAYSPHNSYADFRRPTDPTATVVAIRMRLDRLSPHFDDCRPVARVDNGLGVDNEAQGAEITVCRGLRGRWDVVWEDLRFLA